MTAGAVAGIRAGRWPQFADGDRQSAAAAARRDAAGARRPSRRFRRGIGCDCGRSSALWRVRISGDPGHDSAIPGRWAASRPRWLSRDAEWNLIVACDMPGLSGVALAALMSEAGKTLDADVLIPDCGGSAQPLCAVYHRRALATIRQALRGDRRKSWTPFGPCA